MINTLYAVLVVEEENEQIFAMSTAGIYGNDGPELMQAVSSSKKAMEGELQYAKDNFPEKEFKLVKFIRGH